jgi:Protein of unknown function (DUF3467)
MAEEREVERPGTQAAGTVTVRWDDAKMQSSYANACNVMSTREEIMLLFGLNQAWRGGVDEVTIQLTNRILLNPHAAKRLSMLLANVLREHEARFGVINMEARRAGE